MTVNVIVLDANDNAPTFDRSHYEVIIGESMPIAAQSLTVNASDLDEGANAQMSYSISNDLKSQFHIDPKTGIISTKVVNDDEGF